LAVARAVFVSHPVLFQDFSSSSWRRRKRKIYPGSCTSTIFDSTLNDFPRQSDAKSCTSPLQRPEISFNGFWKCRTAAVLQYSASLARKTQPGYPWRFRDYQLTGKASHSFSDPRCFPLGVSQQYESQQDMSKEAGAAILTFGWRQHKETCDTSGQAWRSDFVQRLPSALLGSNIYRSCSRPQAAPWMSRLHDIAVDPVECSWGLLGYFSSVQMDIIESLFSTIGVADP